MRFIHKMFVVTAVVAVMANAAKTYAEDANDPNDPIVKVKIAEKLIEKAISAFHSWNDSHPCVLVQPDGKTFYVPLIPSKESRGTINFDQDPFAGPQDKDNGIIKVEFVNFGRFADVAQFQVKVDKHHGPDKDRGHTVKNGQETDIGIGASIRGFYFAIRDEGRWNTEKVLAENPNAFIKVTIVKVPAK